MLELINEPNSHIFDELSQDYEDEFSATSGKKKNQDGKYSIDVDWRTPNVGYYWKVYSDNDDGTPNDRRMAPQITGRRHSRWHPDHQLTTISLAP